MSNSGNELKALVAVHMLRNTGIVERVLNPELINAVKPTEQQKNFEIDNLDKDQKDVVMGITNDCLKHINTPNIMVIEAGLYTFESLNLNEYLRISR